MSIISYIIAILVLFLVLKLLSLPMKLITKFIINSVIGGVIIYGLSLIGIGVEVTYLSAALVGILGIPGVIIALIIQFLL